MSLITYVDFFALNPLIFATFCGILGLLIGSFINVVVYRLPIMLEREWHEQCVEFLEDELAEKETDENSSVDAGKVETSLNQANLKEEDPRFDLMVPASHCPHCKHKIKAYENIPVLSYLMLGRKCRQCHESISFRYPFVELLTAVLSFVVAWHFGFGVQTMAALFLTWVLVTLSFIDYDTQLLPDVITIPMVWVGLILSLSLVFVDPATSIIGAVAGYLSLWIVFQLFKLVTGKEGMGFGDFKLLAVLGAWFGWKLLPVIILLSSFAGAFIGIALILLKQQNKDKPIPFGPYLAIAGWLAMLYGESLIDVYFQFAAI